VSRNVISVLESYWRVGELGTFQEVADLRKMKEQGQDEWMVENNRVVEGRVGRSDNQRDRLDVTFAFVLISYQRTKLWSEWHWNNDLTLDFGDALVVDLFQRNLVDCSLYFQG
jgi:hypothetical protein